MKSILTYVTALLLLLTALSCQKSAQKTVPVCCAPPAAQASGAQPAGWPAASIYQLAGSWQTEDGKQIPLSALGGKVQLVAMVFTHCAYACPRTVENLKAVEAQLPETVRSKVGFVLVSFDTARDSVARLRAFAREKDLDGSWTLLRGEEEEVRALSLLLDIRYAPLPGGDFSHTNAITVLDASGQVRSRIEGLDVDAGQLAASVAALAGR